MSVYDSNLYKPSDPNCSWEARGIVPESGAGVQGAAPALPHTAYMNGSTRSSGPTEDKGCGVDLPHDAYRLGVDATGREHWHSAYEHHLWVLRDGDLVHEREVHDIVQWVLFVDEDLEGWQEREPVEETNGLASLADDLRREVA